MQIRVNPRNRRLLYLCSFAVCFFPFALILLQGAVDTSYSGEYEFLHEGELLQLTVQPVAAQTSKKVTGFISHRGELDSDHGTMLDFWIQEGDLSDGKLQFRTSTIHGTWFEFQGAIGRGPGHTRSERGFYIISGKLTQHVLDRDRKETAQSRQVALNSLPQEAE